MGNKAARLEALHKRHAEIDEILNEEQSRPHPDQNQVRRLKQRKLQLKDLIAQTESQNNPQYQPGTSPTAEVLSLPVSSTDSHDSLFLGTPRLVANG